MVASQIEDRNQVSTDIAVRRSGSICLQLAERDRIDVAMIDIHSRRTGDSLQRAEEDSNVPETLECANVVPIISSTEALHRQYFG